MSETAAFRPEDPAFYHRDADAVFRRLRAEDPLHWYEPGRFWAVTRHADVQSASQRPRLFSSEQGTQLFEVLRRARGESPLGAMGELKLGASTIIRMDPPRHNRQRKLAIGAFTPRRIAQLEPEVRRIAKQYLDPVASARECELQATLSHKLPMDVISALVGIPEEDRDQYRIWVNKGLERDPDTGKPPPENMEYLGKGRAYIQQLLEARRREPRNDLIPRHAVSSIDEDRFDLFDFHSGLLVRGLFVV